ncbi:MAG: hypothetical protein EOL95_04415 [Bacteroidia bacterium]|nr:hypothetical protein [Bacteroidia bacterium]
MTIAVDFDGTIVTHEYPKIGQEIPFAIATLKRLQSENECKLILWSVRSGKLLDEAVEYCRIKGLEFYAVNKDFPEEVYDKASNRKVNADIYIDDRNVGGLPDWGVIYAMIKGKTRPIYDTQYIKPKPKNIIIRFGEWLAKR